MLGEHLFYKEITMASAHIEHKLSLLPDLPGSYQMKDINGKIIYVGKAKNLKNRVRSYFKSSHDGKVAAMVSQVADFNWQRSLFARNYADSKISAVLQH